MKNRFVSFSPICQSLVNQSNDNQLPTPVNHRHLSITDTCQSPTPVNHQHLSITDTCQSPTPVNHGHLSITDTCQSPTPVTHLAVHREAGEAEVDVLSQTALVSAAIYMQLDALQLCNKGRQLNYTLC
jgi:hypothetical protein